MVKVCAEVLKWRIPSEIFKIIFKEKKNDWTFFKIIISGLIKAVYIWRDAIKIVNCFGY